MNCADPEIWKYCSKAGNTSMEYAGENGCGNCQNFLEYRRACPTTCNWCTPGGTWPTTTTTTTTRNPNNDCSTCAIGSPGSFCEADNITLNCRTLPWHSPYICGDEDMVDAGKNGCKNCLEIRSHCATTCNWCNLNETKFETTLTDDTTIATNEKASSKMIYSTKATAISSTEKEARKTSFHVTSTKYDETSKINTNAETTKTSNHYIKTSRDVIGNTKEELKTTENGETNDFDNREKRKNHNNGTIIGIIVGVTLSVIFVSISLSIMIRKNRSKTGELKIHKGENKNNSIENNEPDQISIASDNYDDLYKNTSNLAFQNPYYEGDIDSTSKTNRNQESNIDLNNIDFVTANKNIYYQM